MTAEEEDRLRESGGPIIYAVDVPESERVDPCFDIAERYEVRENSGWAGGCIIWARYYGRWVCNPSSTRWLVRRLIEDLEREKS